MVALLEAKLGKQFPANKPRLQVVEGGKAAEPKETDREIHLRMIRALKRHWGPYGMGLIVDQATLGRGTVEDLTTEELVALHRKMDRARECIQDDVPFEVAGLLDSTDNVQEAWG